MPINAYDMPQVGSFVAEPQYGGYTKWGASYAAAPPYASYQPGAEYSIYGSVAPAFSFGHAYASGPAPCTASHQQFPATASFTHEQPIHQPYQMHKTASFTQMPTTASFTCDQPGQPYSYQQYQQQHQQQYAFPQQQSFAAHPQPPHHPFMGDMPQFQFYPSATLNADGPSMPTGVMNHAPTMPGHELPTGPVNHMPADHPQARVGRSQSPMPKGSESHAQARHGRSQSPMPKGSESHAQARHGRSQSPMPKPNSSTSKRPPTKKTEKKSKGCCSCGV